MKPIVSFVIPTLNADKVLVTCLESIKKQTFPSDQIEIIIADGGSTDNTLKIAQEFHCLVVANPLKTAEAGKAIGIQNLNSQYIALIDSDNILPNSNWLTKMIDPLEKDSEIIASEPWEFTYRPHSGFIERYCSLLGANDPYAFITGIYDRQSLITNKWTSCQLSQQDFKKYLKVKLNHQAPIPTVGANGTIFRREFLQKNLSSKFLFDIDIITQVLNQTKKSLYLAKVKQGIIHTYCESSIHKFIRKQNRRVADYFYYQKLRQYNWTQTNKFGTLKFFFYTILFIPMIFDTFRGYLKKADRAWFFHPIACYLTLTIYSYQTINFKLFGVKKLNRQKWSQ